jgi:hypothetical protein
MVEKLRSLLNTLSQKAFNNSKELKILCYDFCHGRVFDFFDFHKELDPSDFSTGTLDLIVSVEAERGGPVMAFKLQELPPVRSVCWISSLRMSINISANGECVDIMLEIAKYFGFTYIMIQPQALVTASHDLLIEKNFKRLIDESLNTTVFYLNLITQ